jgi:hypothetical protein
MKRKVIVILIVGLLMVTVFPGVNAAIHKTDQKEDTTAYESRLFGIGIVRINGFTHVIKGFVIYGINDGQVISMEFINIKYTEVDEVFVGYCTPLIFFFRYNPEQEGGIKK